VVYLEISVSEGLRRTGANTSRPLLAGPDPRAKYQELMRHRRPLYRSVATVRVRTDSRSPARVVNQLVAKLTALAPVPVREVNDETPSR
jgi:shikimate kinase